jgi:diguanylate cyclase (GGDEF)-like protein
VLGHQARQAGEFGLKRRQRQAQRLRHEVLEPAPSSVLRLRLRPAAQHALWVGRAGAQRAQPLAQMLDVVQGQDVNGATIVLSQPWHASRIDAPTIKFAVTGSTMDVMDGSWLSPARLLVALLCCTLSPVLAADARLLDIENRLRGRPDAALAELARVQASMQGSDRVGALVLRGRLQKRQGDVAAVAQTATELDALAAAGPDPLATAAAGLLRALVLTHRGPYSRANRLITDAWTQLPANAPDTLRLHFLETRALLKQRLGKIDESVALYQEAVTLADRLGWAWARADFRSALAYSLFLAQQIPLAVAVNNEAMKLAQEAGDLLALSGANTTESFFALEQQRPDDELRALRNAIDFARQAGARREEALGAANLSDHYLQRGDYATALRTAREAVAPARAVRDLDAESVALSNAGLALIGLGRVPEGLPLVREALELLERADSLSQLTDFQGELGVALEKAGRLKEAWQAHMEHRRLSDERFRREHQQAVLELQEGFDADQRKRELALLAADKQLKEEQLLSRDLQQKLWALGTACGVLLLAAVVLLVRRMRHSNDRLKGTNLLLKVAAEIDPLTGLANRRHFLATMQKIAPDGVFEGSLLLIDIDHFKRINDELGHAAGDAVLVELARRLREALRPEDLTVRWGGEEFLIVLRSLPPDQVEALAERLLSTIGREPVRLDGQSIPVTGSIGFATFPLELARTPLPWERAIDLVDTAMYLAKAHGRNRAYGVRSLQPGQGGAPSEATSLETAWREGRADLKAVTGPATLEVTG